MRQGLPSNPWYATINASAGDGTTSKQMTFTLRLNGETATFTPNGAYTEIEITDTQMVETRVMECWNEWHGLHRFTGETQLVEVKGKSWTEVATEKARARYAQLKAQGWS